MADMYSAKTCWVDIFLYANFNYHEKTICEIMLGDVLFGHDARNEGTSRHLPASEAARNSQNEGKERRIYTQQ